MLYLVATPIGENSEITLRALDVLQNCNTIICESTKETSKLLRAHGIAGKKFEILDEHSRDDHKQSLAELCQTEIVALVSDCGTPGFCDPGADLVRLCRKKNIQVKSILGPSSLMGILSLSGQKIDQFLFRGFLPAETEARRKSLKELTKEKRAIVLMDTPYRLKKILGELNEFFESRRVLLALNLSQEDELVVEGTIKQITSQVKVEKAEFMVLIYPG